MKTKKYRIVTDNYCGYEVQIWRWWFPFWVQVWESGHINTHRSIEEAKEFIDKLKTHVVYQE